jgi:L-alanine-DL-glutamate epimerase-like enolase superfamily enzyme
VGFDHDRGGRGQVGSGCGLAYPYADVATAKLIETMFAPLVHGLDALSPQCAWERMVSASRNLGRPGICSMAIAAVDIALWDLKARFLDLPLCRLLGMVREDVAIYGSGGFTSYSDQRLAEQLSGWVERGIPRVKMKVGSDPQRDPLRVRCAREAIGMDAELFVDANGAYTVSQALELAERFDEDGAVTWFEEPVTSDDLAGLREVREHSPAGMRVAAGEYGYDLPYFDRMLQAEAVDVQQADVTRCAESRSCYVSMRSAVLTTGRFHCTAVRRCMCMSQLRCRNLCTWSISTITSG